MFLEGYYIDGHFRREPKISHRCETINCDKVFRKPGYWWFMICPLGKVYYVNSNQSMSLDGEVVEEKCLACDILD